MLANVGPLVEPITKEQFDNNDGKRQVPPGLFAHNIQQRVVASVHAQHIGAEGVVGVCFWMVPTIFYRKMLS